MKSSRDLKTSCPLKSYIWQFSSMKLPLLQSKSSIASNAFVLFRKMSLPSPSSMSSICSCCIKYPRTGWSVCRQIWLMTICRTFMSLKGCMSSANLTTFRY